VSINWKGSLVSTEGRKVRSVHTNVYNSGTYAVYFEGDKKRYLVYIDTGLLQDSVDSAERIINAGAESIIDSLQEGKEIQGLDLMTVLLHYQSRINALTVESSDLHKRLTKLEHAKHHKKTKA
jgi:hypothetical protein